MSLVACGKKNSKTEASGEITQTQTDNVADNEADKNETDAEKVTDKEDSTTKENVGSEEETNSESEEADTDEDVTIDELESTESATKTPGSGSTETPTQKPTEAPNQKPTEAPTEKPTASTESKKDIEVIDGVLYINSDKAWDDFDNKNYIFTKCVIADGVTKFDDRAFWWWYELTEITIPNSVTSLGFDAFFVCDLKKLTITNDKILCSDYDAPTEVLFTDNIDVAKEYVADYYEIEVSIVLFGEITEINDAAFFNEKCLVGITLPEGVTKIGNQAFEGTKLKEITIPSSVTTIGFEAFYGCTNLVIHGTAGSYAEIYASENGIPFVPLT